MINSVCKWLLYALLTYPYLQMRDVCIFNVYIENNDNLDDICCKLAGIQPSESGLMFAITSGSQCAVNVEGSNYILPFNRVFTVIVEAQNAAGETNSTGMPRMSKSFIGVCTKAGNSC